MANKYMQLLASKHSLSRVCAGRQKMAVEDILDTPLTILDVDMTREDLVIDGNPTEFGVYVFAEYPDFYVCGGQKLTEIAKDIVSIAKKENLEISNLDLHIKLTKLKTKSNNTFIDVEFID